MPAYKLGRWDGMVRFCDVGGRTYLHLLDRLLPIVMNDGYEIEVEDHRQSYKFDFQPVSEDSFDHIMWPPKHPAAGEPIILRDYQVSIINMFLENPQGIAEVATGAGKTLITAALSASVEPYGRSVVIVPNRSLVTQTEKDYRNMGLDVGVLYGDRKEYTCTHTIATWQSIESLVKDNKKGRRLEEMENLITDQIAVIVDECFAPGTNVLTPTGYVPIESLRPGDTVINYDQEAKLFKQDTVVKLHENLKNSASEKMYEITMDNNATICVTGNHKFLTDAGWVRADELTPEHNIIDIDK
jgi:hypothetical protein